MLNNWYDIFTKEYKQETEYREFMKKMLHNFELNNKSENIEDKVNRLASKNFVSNFRIKVGEYQ